jgi:hypothetical protein
MWGLIPGVENVGGNVRVSLSKNGEFGIQEAKSLFFSVHFCSISLRTIWISFVYSSGQAHLLPCIGFLNKTNTPDCLLFLFNALIIWYVFTSDCKYACTMTQSNIRMFVLHLINYF